MQTRKPVEFLNTKHNGWNLNSRLKRFHYLFFKHHGLVNDMLDTIKLFASDETRFEWLSSSPKLPNDSYI